MQRLVGILILFLLTPFCARAAVVINELAWMGNTTSANDEWIELYNSGSSAVNVDGWTLEDGMNLSVTLVGSINAGDYAVLERTDDSSAPGSAFMIYTGALANTGATLTLKDSDGSTQDVVAGGENWESVGGDNTTKETAQLTTQGWITALATPGEQNATKDSGADDDESDTNHDSDTVKNSAPVKSATPSKTERKLTLPGSQLSLQISVPDVVYVNQAVKFSAEPSGLGPALTESLAYRWNFGDIGTGNGKSETHVYEYPGEYIVTVWAGYARQEQISRHTVTVLPVKFSITKNLSGDIQVHNDSPYEVDVSGYRLVAGSNQITFPNLSFIPERGTVTVSKHTLGKVDRRTQIQLHDHTGNLLAGYTVPTVKGVESNTAAVAGVAVPMVETIAPTISLVESNSGFTFHTSIVEELPAATTSVAHKAATTEPEVPLTATEHSQSGDTHDWTMLGLAAVVLLGVFGTYVGSQKGDKTG